MQTSASAAGQVFRPSVPASVPAPPAPPVIVSWHNGKTYRTDTPPPCPACDGTGCAECSHTGMVEFCRADVYERIEAQQKEKR